MNLLEISLGSDLLLRTPLEEDAPILTKLVEKNRERLREFLVWVDFYQTMEHARRFIDEAQGGQAAGKSCVLCMVYKGHVVGCVSLTTIELMHRKAELGYWIDAAAEGEGIVARSCRALVEYAFNELRLHRIEIVCRVDNTRSRQLAESIGGVQEGVARENFWIRGEAHDSALYSILSTDLPPDER